MKLVEVSALCLLGILSLCVSVEAGMFDIMKEAALTYPGALPCGNWDCDCAFKRQRGCCCAANDMGQLEEQTFMRMVNLWQQLITLDGNLSELTDNSKIAFRASMPSSSTCFGPYTSNVPIPYTSISLNDGHGYNPALGVFTAPRTGLYSFALSVYSNVGNPTARLYHQVQLKKDGQVVACVWEDNREDQEDSGTQTVLLSLRRGNQVYVELLSGRMLCGNTDMNGNSFTGYLLYPLAEE
ncbi:cerebellin 18 [Osmerus eperlanus]|uniref:cerebellin 18 n=1 Tax=Osmerus eperlanus TaxID=29151 RepID=UPI002E107DD6